METMQIYTFFFFFLKLVICISFFFKNVENTCFHSDYRQFKNLSKCCNSGSWMFLQELQMDNAPHSKQKAGGTRVVSGCRIAPIAMAVPS